MKPNSVEIILTLIVGAISAVTIVSLLIVIFLALKMVLIQRGLIGVYGPTSRKCYVEKLEIEKYNGGMLTNIVLRCENGYVFRLGGSLFSSQPKIGHKVMVTPDPNDLDNFWFRDKSLFNWNGTISVVTDWCIREYPFPKLEDSQLWDTVLLDKCGRRYGGTYLLTWEDNFGDAWEIEEGRLSLFSDEGGRIPIWYLKNLRKIPSRGIRHPIVSPGTDARIVPSREDACDPSYGMIGLRGDWWLKNRMPGASKAELAKAMKAAIASGEALDLKQQEEVRKFHKRTMDEKFKNIQTMSTANPN